MKLYSVALSPYASRVRIAIYAKSLPIAEQTATMAERLKGGAR